MRLLLKLVLLPCIVFIDGGPGSFLKAQSVVTTDEGIRNTGVVPVLDLKMPPIVKWQFSANDLSLGNLVVADGSVFVTSGDGHIHALRSSDGSKLWETAAFGDTSISGIAVSQSGPADYLIATSATGIAVFDRNNGEIVWKANVDQGLASPLIVGESIYTGGYNGILYSFRLDNGAIRWKHDFLEDAPADPPGFDGNRARFGDKPARPRGISSDGKLVFLTVFDQCRVLAIDAESGQRAWETRTKGWMLGRPAVGKDQIYVGSQDKNFYAVDISNGLFSWISKTKSRVEASAAVTDRFVFCGSCDSHLYCHDIVTGHLIWKQATDKYEKYGGPIYAQPIVGESAVYLATMEGQIYKFAIDDGKVLWKFRPSADSQIVESCTDGERIYVTTRENFDDVGVNALFSVGP